MQSSASSLTVMLVCLLPLLNQCGDTNTVYVEHRQPTSEELFGPEIDRVVLEVDYGADAAPYTHNSLNFWQYWGVFKDNAERVFMGTGKTVVSPMGLDEMEELPDVTGTSFTKEEIVDIARRHRDILPEGTLASYYAVFLPGVYHNGETERQDVLGLTVGDTGVIALFKPVIAALGVNPVADNVEAYVEQTTLVHEFGHAIGLAHRGVPMQEDHEDTVHPGHCAYPNCVMYYGNEGPFGALDFARKYLIAGDTVIFGAFCLNDIDSYAEERNTPE